MIDHVIKFWNGMVMVKVLGFSAPYGWYLAMLSPGRSGNGLGAKQMRFRSRMASFLVVALATSLPVGGFIPILRYGDAVIREPSLMVLAIRQIV